MARGVIRLPELTLQLVGRVQEPRRSLPRLRRIEDEQGEDFGKRLRGRFIPGNGGWFERQILGRLMERYFRVRKDIGDFFKFLSNEALNSIFILERKKMFTKYL